MTTIREALSEAVDAVRHVKELAARRGDSDINNVLFVYRGNEMIAQIFPHKRQDRDALLDCAAVAVRALEADILVLVVESWHATSSNNPLTGQPWAPGEMQKAADEHDARAKGWVIDTLTVSVFNRAGDAVMQMLPYRISNKIVVWIKEVQGHQVADLVYGDPNDGIDGNRLQGYVPETLCALMTTASLGQQYGGMLGGLGDMLGMSLEAQRARMDCAVVKALAGHQPILGWPRADVLLASHPGTEREREIRMSMGNDARVIKLPGRRSA